MPAYFISCAVTLLYFYAHYYTTFDLYCTLELYALLFKINVQNISLHTC